jgi:hypothetical protein
MLCERSPSCVNHFQSLSSESIYLQHYSSESLQPSPTIEACLSICVYVHISRDTTVRFVTLLASGPGCMKWLTRSYRVLENALRSGMDNIWLSATACPEVQLEQEPLNSLSPRGIRT